MTEYIGFAHVLSTEVMLVRSLFCFMCGALLAFSSAIARAETFTVFAAARYMLLRLERRTGHHT